jgi:hypothetical protein
MNEESINLEEVPEIEVSEIEIPEILPPSDDGVFKTLLTHPDAKPCLRDIIASNIGLPVKEATVRNTELPISDIMEKRGNYSTLDKTKSSIVAICYKNHF